MTDFEQKFNTRRFYASDPSASKLRETCIRFIRCFRELSDLEPGADRAVKESQFEGILAELTDAGITPEMNVGLDVQFYRASPLTTAQYCAGQLMTLTTGDADKASLAQAFFNIDDTGTISAGRHDITVLQPTKPAHSRVLNLMTPFTALAIIIDFLDAKDEVKGA